MTKFAIWSHLLKISMENFIFCAVTSKGPYFSKACEINFRLIFSSQTEWQVLFMVLVSFTLITTNSCLCRSSYHMFLSQIVTFYYICWTFFSLLHDLIKSYRQWCLVTACNIQTKILKYRNYSNLVCTEIKNYFAHCALN